MSRQAARKDILKTPGFHLLASAAIREMPQDSIALIGGLAVGYYANPPVTIDIDFLVIGTCGDVLEAAESGFPPPWQIKTMSFKGSVPAHCVRLSRKDKPDMVIDLLPTGVNKYLVSIVKRAVWFEIQHGLSVPVARAEDIIVLKTVAGREKDLDDIEEILSKMGGKIDIEYVARMLKKIGK